MKAIAYTLLIQSFNFAQAADLVNLVTSLADNASQPILESFVSFSIEFSSFPDFAGVFVDVLSDQQLIDCNRQP